MKNRFHSAITSLAALFLASLSGICLAQNRLPSVQGTYFGLFSNAVTGNLTTALLPYIEQDNLVLAGSLSNQEFGNLEAFGTIHPNDTCNLISASGTTSAVYKATWNRIGDGSGALSGPIAVSSPGSKVNGELVLLRPFSASANAPDLVGNFAGQGTSSTIQLNFSGLRTRRMNLDLLVGRTTSHFSAVFDTNDAGKIAAIGVQNSGNTVQIVGQIKDGTSNIVQLQVSVFSSAGKLLFTDSIIAILIG